MKKSGVTRAAEVLNVLALFGLAGFLLLLILSVVQIFLPRGVNAQTSDPKAVTLQSIEERFLTLKERATAQQTLITTLTTLTGVYALILAGASYTRLQQIREESKASIDSAQKQLEKLSTEIRADVPAVHGIGQRLDQLLAELEHHLPVDGDWTDGDTFRELTHAQHEQVKVDEMVINALELFNISKDVGNRRTVSRLYIRLGQYYIAHATFEHESRHLEEAKSAMAKAQIYLAKALSADASDPISHRALAVAYIHEAIWHKSEWNLADYKQETIAAAEGHFRKSLALDEMEPGAALGLAWIVRRKKNFDEAFELLDKITTSTDDLPPHLRRKFGAYAFLNTACYHVAHLQYLKSEDPASVAKRLPKIIVAVRTNCERAIEVSRASLRLKAYMKRYVQELKPGGDLHPIFQEDTLIEEQLKKLIS